MPYVLNLGHQKKRQKYINGINSSSFCPIPMKFSGMTAVSCIVAGISKIIKMNALRMRSENVTYKAYLQPDFHQIQIKILGRITGVYLTLTFNRYNKLEKNNTPEADSNHNEERITNPCGFVTHIYIYTNKTLDGFFNISKFCLFCKSCHFKTKHDINLK